MRYMGGKARQAKHLVEVIRSIGGGHRHYHEPFLGGGSVFERAAPLFPGRATAADIHPDLIIMWQALLGGWEPPDHLSREEWYSLKKASPSALRGFAGFGCSFGGRWFGGYAASRGDDYCGAAKRGVLRKAAAMRLSGALVSRQSYQDFDPLPGTLVYCDPPYAATTAYSKTEPFDSDQFWSVARSWASSGATVLVSEYSAPGDIECVWERSALKSLNRDTNIEPATEKLFLLQDEWSKV